MRRRTRSVRPRSTSTSGIAFCRTARSTISTSDRTWTRSWPAVAIEALHYYDGVGDGWIEAICPQLSDSVDAVLPAYCMVGLPDFFPKVTQRELMVWWQTRVPAPIRSALWAIHPLALSQTRIAANITLPAGFSLVDTTITAIVTQPTEDSRTGARAERSVGDTENRTAGWFARAVRSGLGHQPGHLLHRPEPPAAEVHDRLRSRLAVHRGRQALRGARRLLARRGAGLDAGLPAGQAHRRRFLSLPDHRSADRRGDRQRAARRRQLHAVGRRPRAAPDQLRGQAGGGLREPLPHRLHRPDRQR